MSQYLAMSDDVAYAAMRSTDGIDGPGFGYVDAFSFAGNIVGEVMRSAGRSQVKPLLQEANRRAWNSRLPGFMADGRVSKTLSWYSTRGGLKRWERESVRRGVNVYNTARNMGDGVFRSTISGYKAIGGRALLSKAGSMMISASNAVFLAPMALELGRAAASGLTMIGRDYSRPEYGSPLMDTQQAFTQRQAGLQAIHNSQLQTRSFFMREAQAFHQ